MGVSGHIVCGNVGGWSGWVGNKWQEGPWKLHNYCKNKTGNSMPRPPAMQWPNLTLAEMNNIVEMDSRIISQCFQSLWAFFFFPGNCWVGFWQMAAAACRIPEPCEALSRLCYIGVSFYFWFFSPLMGCLLWMPLWTKSVISHFLLLLIPTFEIMSSAFLTNRRWSSSWFLCPGKERLVKNLFLSSCNIGHNIFSSAAAPEHRYILTGMYVVLVKRSRTNGSVSGAMAADNLPREYSTFSTPHYGCLTDLSFWYVPSYIYLLSPYNKLSYLILVLLEK